jgi:tRNA(His) guanylyltransferase
MKFDLLEKRLRPFEKINDPKINPEMFIICRIDGKNFSKLTREQLKVEPYNVLIRNSMMASVRHVMDCGFRTICGFTQSDEISLLIKDEKTFGGKIRKYNSVLASEATAIFNIEMKHLFPDFSHAAFDCRTLQLPTQQLVLDYFAWRVSDSFRNCINMWCYHILRKQGLGPKGAQQTLNGKAWEWKEKFLSDNEIKIDYIPDWQKRGIIYYWDKIIHRGYNPVTEENVDVFRKKLTCDVTMKNITEYQTFIKNLLINGVNEETSWV